MEMEDLVFEYRETGNVELEEGMYEAELKRIEKIDTQYGEQLRWVFDVYDEESDEYTEVSGITSQKFTSRSKGFAWFSALGGKVKDGKVNLNEIIGNRALVEIRYRKGRGDIEFPNVTDVKPLPKKSKRKSK